MISMFPDTGKDRMITVSDMPLNVSCGSTMSQLRFKDQSHS